MVLLNECMTISEVAEKLGVTRQRVHALIRTYGVRVQVINSRMFLIPKKEMKKIPSRDKRRKNNGRALHQR